MAINGKNLLIKNMYTLEFYADQETIGTLVALKDGVAVYKDSVNLGDQKSVDLFIAQTKQAGESPKADTSKIDTLLSQIETLLNK